MTATGVAETLLASLAAILAVLGLFTEVKRRGFERRFSPGGERVAIDGGAIHVVDTPAEGVERGAVLLLHGASGNHADMSLALAKPLSALGFRVLAVDRPGHGWSSRSLGRRASSPALQGELIRAALARRGAHQAIVVGHSLAGATALALALEAPQFVRGLVLLAPVSHPWPGDVHWYYRMAARPWIGWAFCRLIVMPAGLFVLRAGVSAVFAPNATPSDYIEATALKLALRPGHFRANAEDVADLKPFVIAQSSRYSSIAAPTEIVAGDCDGVVSASIHSAGCARDIPDSVLTVLPGIGHSPHHSATESVVAAILRAEQRAALSGAAGVETRIAAAG